jgi:raffinose/stachyose/melibiose transport system permease protein
MSASPRGLSARARLSFGGVLVQLLVTIVAAVDLFPVLEVVNLSLKTKRELYVGNPLALPERPAWENYHVALSRLKIGTTFFNTFFYTAVSVIAIAVLASAAAWAIARNKGGFFRFAYVYFIVGILIPFQALFLPIYVIGYSLHLTNTAYGIIFMYIAVGMSFCVFLMTSFMNQVPIELEESARIDGCSIYRIFFSVVLPLLRPAIATLVILQSFGTWNDYLMASLFVSDSKLKTMTVFLAQLFSTTSQDYTSAMAAIVILFVPIAGLFVALQKYFVKGMTVGAVKG